MTREKVNILGVLVDPINMDMALEIVDNWIQTRCKNFVCFRDVHGLVRSQREPDLKLIHNRAGLVSPDGMPLVWVMRRKGHAKVGRVYGPDFMLETFARSVEKGYRHYLYGGTPPVLEKLLSRLTDQFPGVEIVGAESPPFRALTETEDQDVIERINACRPDIVWIGLGSPKQERWMDAHIARLEAPVLCGVGAAFDFHAGVKLQAPRWIQRCGFEWLFRMITEPRRLAGRYLVNNPLFLIHLTLQLTGLREYPAPTQPPP